MKKATMTAQIEIQIESLIKTTLRMSQKSACSGFANKTPYRAFFARFQCISKLTNYIIYIIPILIFLLSGCTASFYNNGLLNTNQIAIQMHYHTTDPNGIGEFGYINKHITDTHWDSELIELMYLYNGIEIKSLYRIQQKIYVDLMPIEAERFNLSSLMGYARTAVLLNTIATLPDVEEIEVLIDGFGGIYGAHFSFDRVILVKDGLILE